MKKLTQSNLLNDVFCNVYGTQFHSESIDDRVMLQKAVFLMREHGVTCGNYEFVWDQYGPFQAELSDDMKKPIDAAASPTKFNDEAKAIMERLKKIFSYETSYSTRYWAEAIASLLYLKRYKYPSYIGEELVQVLEQTKSTLRNHEENIKAIKALEELFAM